MQLKPQQFNYLLSAIILALLAIIIWQAGNKPQTITTITIDTVWVSLPTDTQYLPAPAPVAEKNKPIPPQAQPSSSCDTLRTQYNYLAQNYFAERYYLDTFYTDSIRMILADTVSQNRLGRRRASWQVTYPVVNIKETKETITPPRNQLYVGAGVGLAIPVVQIVPQGNVSLLLKTRRDRIWEGRFMIDTKGLQYASLNYYWKISFRKNAN